MIMHIPLLRSLLICWAWFVYKHNTPTEFRKYPSRGFIAYPIAVPFLIGYSGPTSMCVEGGKI